MAHAPAQFFGSLPPGALGRGQKLNFLNMVMWHIKLTGMSSRPGYTEKFNLQSNWWPWDGVKVSITIRFLRERGDLRWRAIECVLVWIWVCSLWLWYFLVILAYFLDVSAVDSVKQILSGEFTSFVMSQLSCLASSSPCCWGDCGSSCRTHLLFKLTFSIQFLKVVLQEQQNFLWWCPVSFAWVLRGILTMNQTQKWT